jgi:transposase
VSSEFLAAMPDVLTVEEAAEILRISRNSAYALTRQWRETDGRAGLPVIELGRNLRVPKRELERILGLIQQPAATASG